MHTIHYNNIMKINTDRVEWGKVNVWIVATPHECCGGVGRF